MIEYIKGNLTYIDLHYVVLEAGGIGYQIFMPNPSSIQNQQNQETVIYTYQYVREDQLSLFGFCKREERSLFEKLLLVSGIGPKAALSIMSAGVPGQIIVAIQSEDLALLTKLPGIGKKTAQRIILDLKDKLDDLALYFKDDIHIQGFSERKPTKKNPLFLAEINEAIEALLSLGYTQKELDQIIPQLQEVAKEGTTTDIYIKQALQLLAKK